MKKIMALVLVAVMTVGMTLTVSAANSPAAGTATASTTSTTNTVDGIPAAVVAAAAAANMTVGEYRNNTVVETPGLDKADTLPVGQGGHVIINGAATNVTFTCVKQNQATVEEAKKLAGDLGYKVFNVLGVKGPGKFKVATVNFYVKGLKAGKNVKVFQLVNGKLVEVKVVEVREDHVVVDMTQLGTLVFAAN